MFPIHFKLTVGTVEQLQRLTAFLEQDAGLAAASAPKLANAGAQAPGKPNAATTAPSPRTAEAGPSLSVQSGVAPETSTEAIKPDVGAISADDKPVAYADLQKAVLTLHKADPTAAVPIAKSLGADTFKLLPQDKWPEALRLVTEATKALKAA